VPATVISYLHGMDTKKAAMHSTRPALRINLVVSPDNVAEASHFFSMFGKFAISTIQIRPVIYNPTALYRKTLDSSCREYRSLLDVFSKECTARGITLLANKNNAGYHAADSSSILFEYVARIITPYRVWRDDFRWRVETYGEYCRRTKFRQKILRDILSPEKKLAVQSKNLVYDIG
jgi:hypothetical protein